MEITKLAENLYNATASEGKELFRISDPTDYARSIICGSESEFDNWAERDITIVEEDDNIQ